MSEKEKIFKEWENAEAAHKAGHKKNCLKLIFQNGLKSGTIALILSSIFVGVANYSWPAFRKLPTSMKTLLWCGPFAAAFAISGEKTEWTCSKSYRALPRPS
jgi:hypothetical protein